MECYKCGAQLDAGDTCPGCGIDVRVYKKLVATSNYWYNTGLERARVRDMSGAVEALKTSLQYNKVNIPARNLLGLIYYEIGETVSALSEWVISKNCQKKDNLADRYLTEVQSKPSLLNSINQTIKKYNQALLYCRQDSKDLAIIQLKKLASTNPKLLKAHQLLALLYIDAGKYELARKSLRAAEQIDHKNTITMRYRAEVDARLGEKSEKKKKKENTVKYNTGNETIIQPTNLRDNTGRMMIINILVGVAIGVTATYFLIVPNVRQQLQKDTGVEMASANDTISARNQTIQDLESQLDKLEKETQQAKDESAEAKASITNYQKLLNAYSAYHNGELQQAGDTLAEVEDDQLDNSSKAIYDSVKAEVDSQYLSTTYQEAYRQYMNRDYEHAAEGLQKVVDLDDTYSNGDAIYYLAQAYRILGEYQKAEQLYQQVIDNYPNSYKANNSKTYIQEVQSHL